MDKRGFAIIGLDRPKDNLNIGAVLRAARCYSAQMVVTSNSNYKSSPTDTTKAVRHLPLLQLDDVFDALPYDCVPVAVDLLEGATPLHDYKHPERAFYIFGAENATLGDDITNRCRDRVFIPTIGCMNLAATVNVVLYDRLAKQYNF